MIEKELNIKLFENDISRHLDIMPPFVMIDTFEANLIEKTAESTLKVHENAWYFKVHIPSERVFPASLLTESMLQTMVLLLYSLVGYGADRSFVTNIDVRIKKKVQPGMEILNKCELAYEKRGVYKFKASAVVSKEIVAQGKFEYASPKFMFAPNCRMDRVM